MDNVVDFFVLRQHYDQAVRRNWKPGEHASHIYLLTQARFLAAIELMWPCGTTACALRVASEHRPRKDGQQSWLLAYDW